MSEIRYTEEAQKLRHERLETLKERLKSVSDVADLAEDPRWKSLSRTLASNIEMERRTQRRISAEAVSTDKTDSEVRRELSNSRVREEGYAFVIELVEKRETQIQHLRAEIGHVEEQIKQAAEQLA